MANLTLIQNNFMSGEVSPLIEGSIQSPRYQTGLRLCQNLLPHRLGGLCKRPGTTYIGNTRGNAKARLIEMEISGTYYVIELTNQQARIWKSDYSLDGGGTPTILSTPWTESQLFEVKYAIMKGVMYLTHPLHAPRTISLSGSTWSVATPTFTGDRTFAVAGKYPKAVFFYSGRLGLAGTVDEPTAIFLSRPPVAATGVDRYTDFTLGTAEDNAIYLLESDISSIIWALGSQRLTIGTRRAIWMDTGAPVTPAAFDTAIISYTGASEPQAVMSETIALYAGRGGKSIHALIYDSNSEAYQDVDLSQGAEHFLTSPIVDMKIQNFPQPILWMVREDGLLISCSVDIKSGMVAWARHPMADATVESIAVAYGDDEDILWLSVLRGSTRTVEYMRFLDPQTTAQKDFHYVDCGLAFAYGSPTKTVTGLSHLEGKTVTAWADGAVLPAKVVASGSVTYDTEFSAIHIGLAIESRAQTLRPETPANGTSQGKQKNIEQASVRIYRSLGGEIGATEGERVKFLTWKSGEYLWGSILGLYTGDLEAQIVQKLSPDATLDLTHIEPAPFNLLAIIYKVAIKEP